MEHSSFRIGSKVEVILGDEPVDWSPIAAYLARELEVGASGTHEGCHIRIAASGATSHHPERVYGVSGGLDGGRFVVPDGAGHWCAFDPRQCVVDQKMRVELDLCCPHFRPTVLLDWLIMPISHFAMAAFDFAPFHASAAKLPGQSIGPTVFSAWSGVGKTNLVLWAMGQGGSFYGDDQVIVGADAQIQPSYRRIAVYGYNRSLVAGLPTRARLKLKFGDSVHRAARTRRGRMNFALAYVANGFGSLRVAPTELGGQIGETETVSAHIMCHSLASGDSVSLLKVPRDDGTALAYSRAHIAVMEYEYSWFRRFLQTWQWAVCSDVIPWDALAARWTSSLECYFRAVPNLFLLNVPRGLPKSIAEEVWSAGFAEQQIGLSVGGTKK